MAGLDPALARAAPVGAVADRAGGVIDPALKKRDARMAGTSPAMTDLGFGPRL